MKEKYRLRWKYKWMVEWTDEQNGWKWVTQYVYLLLSQEHINYITLILLLLGVMQRDPYTSTTYTRGSCCATPIVYKWTKTQECWGCYAHCLDMACNHIYIFWVKLNFNTGGAGFTPSSKRVKARKYLSDVLMWLCHTR